MIQAVKGFFYGSEQKPVKSTNKTSATGAQKHWREWLSAHPHLMKDADMFLRHATQGHELLAKLQEHYPDDWREVVHALAAEMQVELSSDPTKRPAYKALIAEAQKHAERRTNAKKASSLFGFAAVLAIVYGGIQAVGAFVSLPGLATPVVQHALETMAAHVNHLLWAGAEFVGVNAGLIFGPIGILLAVFRFIPAVYNTINHPYKTRAEKARTLAYETSVFLLNTATYAVYTILGMTPLVGVLFIGVAFAGIIKDSIKLYQANPKRHDCADPIERIRHEEYYNMKRQSLGVKIGVAVALVALTALWCFPPVAGVAAIALIATAAIGMFVVLPLVKFFANRRIKKQAAKRIVQREDAHYEELREQLKVEAEAETEANEQVEPKGKTNNKGMHAQLGADHVPEAGADAVAADAAIAEDVRPDVVADPVDDGKDAVVTPAAQFMHFGAVH